MSEAFSRDSYKNRSLNLQKTTSVGRECLGENIDVGINFVFKPMLHYALRFAAWRMD
jgi:hypothetical protein